MRPTTTRIWFPSLLAFSALAALFSSRAAPVGAAPDGRRSLQALSEKEHTRRLRLLRRAAQDYHFHRKSLSRICHHCSGTGKVAGRIRRRGAKSIGLGSTFSLCPTCEGNGRYISKRSFMKIYFAMRSPAFRAAADRREQIEALYDRAQRGELKVAGLDRYVYDRGELLDAEHAIAWYRFDKSKQPVATQWIWRADEGSTPCWFAYAAASDGAWPSPEQSLTSLLERARQRRNWKSVPRTRRSSIDEVLQDLDVDRNQFYIESNGTDLRLRQRRAALREMSREDVGRLVLAAVEIESALHEADLGYDIVRIEWQLPMQHTSGRLRMLRALRVDLDVSSYSASDWRTLDFSARVDRLRAASIEHKGYRVVLRGDA